MLLDGRVFTASFAAGVGDHGHSVESRWTSLGDLLSDQADSGADQVMMAWRLLVVRWMAVAASSAGQNEANGEQQEQHHTEGYQSDQKNCTRGSGFRNFFQPNKKKTRKTNPSD